VPTRSRSCPRRSRPLSEAHTRRRRTTCERGG
jgi:hypothetical protein